MKKKSMSPAPLCV